ncbi:MAG: DUF1549 domain-containing protein [Planctomycetaceae bacterium]
MMHARFFAGDSRNRFRGAPWRLASLLLALLTTVGARGDERPLYFTTDIIPILTKLGCNSGGCHGKATGQNGFKLSLFGFDPDGDHAALVRESGGRRVLAGDASGSLLLLKAAGRIPHGGGRPLVADSSAFRTLIRWIDGGANGPGPNDPILENITVEPSQAVLATDARQQLRVAATFSNGQSRDVTHEAVFTSNDDDIGDCDKNGLVATRTRGGLFAVMVQFGGKVAAFYGTVPYHEQTSSANAANLVELESQLQGGIDKSLLAQWKRLGIQPSPPIDDAAYIRRAMLDLCGLLPSVDEVSNYVADSRADKRSRLIDRLLERPEYADLFALKWAAILRNRGSGYSTSQQRAGTSLFTGWIRDSVAANKPYDQFVTEILTASGSQKENPPAVWYRQVRTITDYVESTSQAFLGVRIGCAQCHHHPAERWSQADYFGLAAVFARVGRKGGFADAEVPTEEIIFLKDQGEIVHPRTGEVMRPRPLGGPDFELGSFDDPRIHFARWMTARGNPYFARAMANRMWGHFFGRGIIEPIDDARSTNPPSNPELLDDLARGFIESGYDVKQLIRVICSSYAYRLSSAPTESNQDDVQTFARYYPRRIPAEMLLDAISQVLEVPTEFPGGPGEFPPGTRAAQLPDENVPVNFLEVFGRPARESACECERTDAPALAQALELVNSTEIQRKLTADGGYVARLAKNNQPVADNVRAIFLRFCSRPPSDKELATSAEFLNSQSNRAEAYRSLCWSLLATNEFLFNH